MKVDLTFVLDSSSSIGAPGWRQALGFVNKVVNGLDIGENRTRLTLLSYSAVQSINIHFDESFDPALMLATNRFYTQEGGVVDETAGYTYPTLQSIVSSTTYLQSGTRTGRALLYLSQFGLTLERGYRAATPVVVVVTDGRTAATDRSLLRREAERLANQNVTVYAIGVGGEAGYTSELSDPTSGSRLELATISQSEDRVIVVQNYSELLVKANLIQNKFDETICSPYLT